MGRLGTEESTRKMYGVPRAQNTSHALGFWALFWDIDWEESVSSLEEAGCGTERLWVLNGIRDLIKGFKV